MQYDAKQRSSLTEEALGILVCGALAAVMGLGLWWAEKHGAEWAQRARDYVQGVERCPDGISIGFVGGPTQEMHAPIRVWRDDGALHFEGPGGVIHQPEERVRYWACFSDGDSGQVAKPRHPRAQR